MKKNLIKKQIYLMGMSTILSAVSITGCSKELAVSEDYDVLVQEEHSTTNLSDEGLLQILDVPGESFQLYTQYSCDAASDREWRITSDKFLYITVKTLGLPKDTSVYIDNVHIDTSIKSKYAAFDGILQDTMDDRVHSSQLIGFYISDKAAYYGVNAIEGTNSTFISGTHYGNASYSGGSVTEKRYTEADYMEKEVYANKFQIVYDLLVKGPEDVDYRNISVKTDFLVPVTTTQITYEKNSEQHTKEYSLDLKK